MVQLPIIIYHTGKQEYVKHVINQAKKFNRDVYLLGNEENKDFSDKWYDYSLLNKERIKKFKYVYEHMSYNPYKIEMFCFESWFYYYEFAKLMNFKSFVTMDSDVLLYTQLRQEDFAGAEAALGWSEKQEPYIWAYNPYLSYWNLDTLNSFLDFCIEIYENHKEIIRSKWEYHCDNNIKGGVCDMTLFYLWSQTHDKKVKNIIDTLDYKDGVYDIALFGNGTNGKNYLENEFKYSDFFKIKIVRFYGNIPYFFTLTGDRVRIKAIHCISWTKRYIPLLVNGRNSRLCYVYMDIKAFIKRCLGYLARNLYFKKVKRKVWDGQ